MSLRDVQDSDLSVFFEHQQDPNAYRMAAFAPRDRDAFMKHWRVTVLGDASAGKQTVLINGTVAGNVVSWNQGAQRYVGYWIGRDFWGQGVASAALSDYLKHDKQRPLHAAVAAHNLGSIRVLEKCGFRRAGEGEQGADGVKELFYRLDKPEESP